MQRHRRYSEEWFRLQRPWRHRSSASDYNLRSRKGEWPACSGRRGNEVRVRFYSSLPQREIVRLQQAECRQVRQRRQRRVLMRPEAAFPYVSAAEGAQHPLIGRRAERYSANSPPR